MRSTKLEKPIDRFWRISMDALLGVEYSLLAVAFVWVLVVMHLSRRQQFTIDFNLSDILGSSAVSYVMIIATILASIYLMLTLKLGHVHKLTITRRIAGHLEDSILLPVLFEAFSIFQYDIFKSLVATVVYGVALIVILLNTAFQIVLISYYIKRFCGDD